MTINFCIFISSVHAFYRSIIEIVVVFFPLPLYQSTIGLNSLFQTHENAQIDVLSALHIDINNKEVISLFTRLFPGNTTTEALNTKLGEMVGMALTSVISDIIEGSTGDSFV